MENERKSRWLGNEFWFKFGHQSGLKRFDTISTLDSTQTAVALRTLKYHFEKELGLEITDELFVDIFKKVCAFSPVPGLGPYAKLEFIQPLQRLLEKHHISKDKYKNIWNFFRIFVDSPTSFTITTRITP